MNLKWYIKLTDFKVPQPEIWHNVLSGTKPGIIEIGWIVGWSSGIGCSSLNWKLY